MLDPIQVLEREGIKTTSYIGAVQDVMMKEYSAQQHMSRVSDLIGFQPSEELDDLTAKYFHAYVVQGIVKAHLAKQELSEKQLLDISLDASARAKHMYERVTTGDMQYVTVSDDSDTKKREFKDGKNKQELAYDIYAENVGKKRMEIIGLIMEALDMSKAGATTYYQNSKKQHEAEK